MANPQSIDLLEKVPKFLPGFLSPKPSAFPGVACQSFGVGSFLLFVFIPGRLCDMAFFFFSDLIKGGGGQGMCLGKIKKRET